MTRRFALVWIVVAAMTAACDADTPKSPTSPTVVPPATTASPAPVTTSVRVECATTVVNGRTITCKATAVVSGGSSAAGANSGRLLDVDVSGSAQWSSSNGAVAKVTNGQVEALSVGTSTIAAVYQGVAARVDIEVTRNEAQIIDAAFTKYLVNGRLESNTCSGTDPIREYAGEIEVQRAGEASKPVQLTYSGRVQRIFRAGLEANVVNGDVRVISEVLLQPFGPTSPVASSRITGAVSTTGATTTMTEEMSCTGGGAIVFRIDTRKFF